MYTVITDYARGGGPDSSIRAFVRERDAREFGERHGGVIRYFKEIKVSVNTRGNPVIEGKPGEKFCVPLWPTPRSVESITLPAGELLPMTCPSKGCQNIWPWVYVQMHKWARQVHDPVYYLAKDPNGD